MPNNLLLPGTNNVTLSTSTTANKKRYSWALVAVMLFVGRAIRVLASWDTYHFLQSSSTPFSIFCFYSVFWASIILCLLQRPWKGKRISKRRFSRVCLLSGIFTLALVCWLQSLNLCGIFRVLFFDGVELPLIFVYSLIGSGESFRRQKLHGLVVVGVAYLLLFTSPSISSMLDFQSTSVENVENMDKQRDRQIDEKSSTSMLSKLRGFAVRPSSKDFAEEAGEEQPVWSDPKSRESARQLYAENAINPQGNQAYDASAHISLLGILLIATSSILFVIYRIFSLKISSSLDGPKRVFAISNSLAALILMPICVFQQWFVTSVARSQWPSLIMHSCTFALGYIVVPFYIQSFVSSKMGHLGSTELNFGSTLVTLIVLNLCTAPSWSLIPEIASGILQLVGIHSLLSGRQIKSYDLNAALGGEF